MTPPNDKAPSTVCPRDTNGDGNCGQPACPVCGPEHLKPVAPPEPEGPEELIKRVRSYSDHPTLALNADEDMVKLVEALEGQLAEREKLTRALQELDALIRAARRLDGANLREAGQLEDAVEDAQALWDELTALSSQKGTEG